MDANADDFEVELADGGDDRVGLEDQDLLLSEDDLDDVDDDVDEDDYPEDATDEDIDLVVALYREDGLPVAIGLPKELANDLDELIEHLRRFPGDGGVTGLVSIASEFFVAVRVRGRHVQVMLSDEVAAHDWPIAHDVIDFLGLDVPDEDDEPLPAGDLDIFADLGISDFDMESLCSHYEMDSVEAVADIADKLKFGPQYARVVQTSFGR